MTIQITDHNKNLTAEEDSLEEPRQYSTYLCEVMTLQQIISELGLPRIDLLKVTLHHTIKQESNMYINIYQITVLDLITRCI